MFNLGRLCFPTPLEMSTFSPPKLLFNQNEATFFVLYSQYLSDKMTCKRLWLNSNFFFCYFLGKFDCHLKCIFLQKEGQLFQSFKHQKDARSNIFIWKNCIFLPEYKAKRTKLISFSVCEK